VDYHETVMTSLADDQGENRSAAEGVLRDTAARLRELLTQLAASLRPFPAFLNMTTLQAVELEPPFGVLEDRGCVVVAPDGNICQLELKMVPGAPGVRETDQIEEFLELDLPAGDYILYAATAIGLLTQELRRRETGRP